MNAPNALPKMGIVDANVGIRFLITDPTAPAQTADARKLIREAPSGSLYLTALVVAEIIWNLRGYYKSPRSRIIISLQELLSNPSILPESDVVAALTRFFETNLDFTDCFLAARSAKTRNPVASYDRDYRKFRDVRVLPPARMLEWLMA